MNETTQEDVIKYIATVADNISFSSGTGGCEMAGLIISVLAKHPDMIGPFFDDNHNPIIDDDRFCHQHGCLTFYNTKNEIITPETLKISKTTKRIINKALGG